MNDNHINEEAKHPIRIVSARTGIPQDLLRAWEKRYQAVVPVRSPNGRRLYSDADINKLRLLKRAVKAGRRISDVASLSMGELNALIEDDRAQAGPAPTPLETAVAGKNGYLKRAMSALEAFDLEALHKILSEAAVSLSSPDLRRQLFVPMFHAIGDRWQDGSMRVVHEHLFTEIVKDFLENMHDRPASPAAPLLMITTPAGQRHEFGALMAASTAREHGWDTVYLGPDLPAKEIAAAVKELNPQALAISIVYLDAGTRLRDELQQLKRYLDGQVLIIAGGRVVPSLKSLLDDLDIVSVNDFTELPDILSGLAK